MIGSPRRRSLALLLACGLALGLGQDASLSTSVRQGAAGFGHAFLKSFAVIMATEIGDKTFFIAAIMAMRYSRVTTWVGAVGALVVMTVLSTLLGHMAPLLIPKAYTHYAAALLFLVFGVRMLRDAKDAGSGASEELEEVELELAKKQDVESGANGLSTAGDSSLDDLSPRAVLLQAFTLTFLAEWGDRSQIATIALAAAEEPFGVTFGAIIGHSLCTGMAVIGGKLLASRISERMVLGLGGVLFVLFALVAAIQGPG